MSCVVNLTPERLRSLDPGDMLGKTLELPAQIERGLELGHKFARAHDLAKPAAVDWVGLGGSAVAGDLLRAFGAEPPELPLRITVQRYPRPLHSMRLVCSYSGNTIEAVRCFEETVPSQVWFAMSSGGQLEELSRARGVPHLALPLGYPPRAAVGFSLGAMLAVLEELYGFGIPGLPTLLTILKEDAQGYTELSASRNRALKLATRLAGHTPVIYSVDGVVMPAVARRFCAQLAENSKIWSHTAELPEAAHNEVEALAFLSQLLPAPCVVFLGSWHARSFADPRPGLRTVLDSLRVTHETLDPEVLWGGNLSRIEPGLRMMLLLDAASIYLALLHAVNPMEIPVITRLKSAGAQP